MNDYDELVGMILALAIFGVMVMVGLILSSCRHGSGPRCTMGLSDESQAVCCEVYCKGKGMEMKDKQRSKVNPEELQCICIQKENPDNSHADAHPFLY